jgi:hypothetical protein
MSRAWLSNNTSHLWPRLLGKQSKGKEHLKSVAIQLLALPVVALELEFSLPSERHKGPELTEHTGRLSRPSRWLIRKTIPQASMCSQGAPATGRTRYPA